jgi:putative serine protease PepD
MTETPTIPLGPQPPYGQSQPGPYRPNPYGQQPYGQPPQPPQQPPQQQPSGRGPSKPKRGLAALVVAAVAAGLIGGGAGAAATYAFAPRQEPANTSLQQPAPQNQPSGNVPAAGSVQQVAAKVLPSVVSIQMRSAQGQTGGGSGIILSADGRILTNNHVAEVGANGGELSVTFNNGKTAKAEIVGLDPTTDLAVIKAQGVSGLTPIQLGSSSTLAVGQQVVAIGSPLGLSGTVTTGIVSSLNRPVRTGDAEDTSTNTVIDAIQTDAAINPGNSGGALVNMAGQLVGVNSAIATVGGSQGGQSGNIGVGFAIPVDQARPIADELLKDGKAQHALIGVSLASSANGTETSGAQVSEVNPGSAAEKAGLKVGDVVTKLGDRVIADADSLIAAVRSHRPGEKVTLTFVRDGKTQTAEVTLGSDNGQQPQQQQEQPPPNQQDPNEDPNQQQDPNDPGQWPPNWPR